MAGLRRSPLGRELSAAPLPVSMVLYHLGFSADCWVHPSGISDTMKSASNNGCECSRWGLPTVTVTQQHSPQLVFLGSFLCSLHTGFPCSIAPGEYYHKTLTWHVPNPAYPTCARGMHGLIQVSLQHSLKAFHSVFILKTRHTGVRTPCSWSWWRAKLRD